MSNSQEIKSTQEIVDIKLTHDQVKEGRRRISGLQGEEQQVAAEIVLFNLATGK